MDLTKARMHVAIAVAFAAALLAGAWCVQPAYADDDLLEPAAFMLEAQGAPDELTTAATIDTTVGRSPLYRLYNAATGEHHYTLSWYEASVCFNSWGWSYEGVAWYAPDKSSVPVYRLYSPSLNLHHYTTSAYERDVCVRSWGWNYEGIAWYSDPAQSVPLYRLYHPETDHHHYTTSAYERDVCVRSWGWRYEGVAWYGFSDGPDPANSAKKISGDSILDTQLRGILQFHNSLRSAFDYVSSFSYIKGSEHSSRDPHYLPESTTIAYAKEMLTNRGGNCYRFASLFNWMARGLGYDSKVVQGWVPSYSEGRAAHGWTEIEINGTKYIFDADNAKFYPSVNWYMRTYADPPTNYGNW